MSEPGLESLGATPSSAQTSTSIGVPGPGPGGCRRLFRWGVDTRFFFTQVTLF